MGSSAAELPGLGGSLGISFLSLGLVCLLAYFSLRWLSHRGVGKADGPIRVLARCPLEPRRAIFLLQVGDRCLLVGVGDGPVTLLTEIDPAGLDCARPVSASLATTSRFSEILARLGSKGRS